MPSAPGHPQQESSLELSLSRNVDAPGIARSAIARLCLALELDGSSRQTLILLVSEVVSNAVLHSQAHADHPILLNVAVSGENVRITVTDAGDGFVPCERDPRRAIGGYGLYLLEKAASRWGVEAGAPTSVWFELDL